MISSTAELPFIVRNASRWAFILALVVVLALALIPRPPAITAEVNDKVEHAAAFLVLTALGMIGWPSRRLGCVIVLAVIGAAIELLQGTSLIQRDMSLFDWITDLLGIGAGTLIVILLGPLSAGVSSPEKV